ncbi:hypothetical protein MYCGRDRAFT_49004 [Lecanosticta acicola]|uniref:N-acetyltransferase domain-containing protein n=1 Tax=Lecanosticta acicola TaxID=111012 RepID=A0AAI8YXB2_9PEZI|nr:hypothetical protein MYCGRDRAFT_49004 [Lecanosticta acicola]
MPVRPATYADLLPASKFLAKAFEDEYLFGEYMHPHRKEYPGDFYLTFLRNFLRIPYVSGAMDAILVSYKENEQGQEQVTGIAVWKRNSAHPGSKSLFATAKIRAMEWYNNYFEPFLCPNRAIDPSRQSILGDNWPFIQHHWTGSRAEVWDLALLGVDPSQGGQGFGKELVSWGLEKAKGEGVGCSVVSAEGKEGFYERCGFTIVGTVRDEGGDENPMNRHKIRGGTILFWDNGRDLSGVKKYGES